MKQFKTVLKFEFFSYAKGKPYIITTLLMMALVIILCNIPNISKAINSFSAGTGREEIVSNEGNVEIYDDSTVTAAIYDPAGIYTDSVLNDYAGRYKWIRVYTPDEAVLSQYVESGEYEFALIVNGLEYTLIQAGSDSMFNQVSFDGMIKEVYQKNALLQKGINREDIDSILDAPVKVNYISVGKDVAQSYWLGYALLMLLYMAILLYGQFVMSSVVTEKTSKAMELLITSAKPVCLIFGKVIGVGLAGLAQFSSIIIAAVITLNLTKDAWMEFSPMVAAMISLSSTLPTFIYAIIFFLLGFFIFAFLYAGFASTVSRMEDANSIVIMPMMLFVSAFLVAMLSMGSPSAGYVTVCSFVPFLSPLVMFMRICVTDVPFIQIIASIIINTASVVAVGILSAKIYRAGVMLYGKTPKIKDIIKYMIKA